MRKLTISYIKKQAKELGTWIILDDTYKNCHTKLLCKCVEEGHIHRISWDHIKGGIGCVVCYNEKTRGSFTKLNIEKVKHRVKDLGNWEVLDNVYVNAYTKLNCRCTVCGYCHKIRWNDISQGVGCPICYNKKRGISLKLSIDDVKVLNQKIGNWIILSDKYEGAHKKLDCKCVVCGYLHQMCWANMQQCQKCPICKGINCSIRMSGENHPNWKGGISCDSYCDIWSNKDFKELIKERDGYKCLNPYCNSKNPNDLNIHHINYNKSFCDPENLITVCRSCNAAANKDREFHEAWYKAVMYRRYNYKY